MNDNSWAEFRLHSWCFGVSLVGGIGPLGQGDNLAGGVKRIYDMDLQQLILQDIVRMI